MQVALKWSVHVAAGVSIDRFDHKAQEAVRVQHIIIIGAVAHNIFIEVVQAGPPLCCSHQEDILLLAIDRDLQLIAVDVSGQPIQVIQCRDRHLTKREWDRRDEWSANLVRL